MVCWTGVGLKSYFAAGIESNASTSRLPKMSAKRTKLSMTPSGDTRVDDDGVCAVSAAGSATSITR